MGNWPRMKGRIPVSSHNSSEDKSVYRIQGMDCAEEIAVLKREVGPVVDCDEWPI